MVSWCRCFAVFPVWWLVGAAGDDEVCEVDGGCEAGASTAQSQASAVRSEHGEYFWPQGRGHPRHYGQSPYSFGATMCNFSHRLSWTWQHPDGRYNTIVVGKPLLDDERNVYIATTDGIWKFSIEGELLWSWRLDNHSSTRNLPNNPAIMDGLLYNCITTGEVFALSMETGELVWQVMASDKRIGGDTAFVTAVNGTVLLDVDEPHPEQRRESKKQNRIIALNGKDGSKLWEFAPDVGVWNFLPLFPEDGTIVFQTWNGGAYRLNMTDGTPLWSQGQDSNLDWWTDGGPALGPNGLLYVVKSAKGMMRSAFSGPGDGEIAAHRVVDGSLVWNQSALEQGIYTYPVVGRLSAGAGLSVVTGVGSLAWIPLKMQIYIAMFPAVACGLVVGLIWASCKCRVSGCRAARSACVMRPLASIFVCASFAVIALVALGKKEYTYSVQAFDAESGDLQWRVELPAYRWYSAAGDEEGVSQRHELGMRPVCLPCASSYFTLDAQGALYFGHLDGRLYRMTDSDRNGKIDPRTEVCSFDSGSAFPTGGPSIAPGILAAASCDTLYVFRDDAP